MNANQSEERLAALLEEVLAESDEDSDMESCDEAEFIESEHNSETEQSEAEDSNEEDDDEVSNNEDDDNRPRTCYFYGRNRFKWSKQEPTRNVRTPAHNLILHLPGLKGEARNLPLTSTEEDYWNLLFTEEILSEILRWTNKKIEKAKTKYARQDRPFLAPIDMTEVRALIGILYISGAFKSSHEDLASMFSTDGMGRDIFRATFSLKRVLFLLSCLRFDNFEERRKGLSSDPLAAISKIFNKFIENSQAVYTLGSYVCIDEILVSFRGDVNLRCTFQVNPQSTG